MKIYNKTIAIFDFCETLINFQTADLFIEFIIKNENYYRYSWIVNFDKLLRSTRLLSLFNKIYPSFNLSKRLKLMQLRGLSENIIFDNAKKYFSESLILNTIPELYDLFKKHQANGDVIIIISGGYLPYLKVFSEIHGVKYFFATEMETKNGVITGNFLGKDCMSRQKIVVLEECIKENKIEFNSSIAYSDSITDLPLLKWADTAFVVSKITSQKWAKQNNLNEIIVK